MALSLWHLNVASINKMLRNHMVYGLTSKQCIAMQNYICEICAKCKISEKQFRKQSYNRAKDVVDFINTIRVQLSVLENKNCYENKVSEK